MCLLIVSKGPDIPESVLTSSNRCNNDGYGLAYYDPANMQMVIHRSMDFAQFKRDLARRPAGIRYIAHMRLATHGAKDRSNCHPFRLSKHLALAHNGHLSGFGRGTLSDTADFARILAYFIGQDALEPNQYALDLASSVCGTHSKIAILSPKSVWILNESAGEWDTAKQVWYSQPRYCPSYTYAYRFGDDDDYGYCNFNGRRVCNVQNCWRAVDPPMIRCSVCAQGGKPLSYQDRQELDRALKHAGLDASPQVPTSTESTTTTPPQSSVVAIVPARPTTDTRSPLQRAADRLNDVTHNLPRRKRGRPRKNTPPVDYQMID